MKKYHGVEISFKCTYTKLSTEENNGKISSLQNIAIAWAIRIKL